MNSLVKQLEDKKKELEGWRRSITSYKRCDECNDFLPETEINHCIEIIAILEQAIAEIEKQRQEILKLIKQEISKDAYSYTFECRLNNFLKNGLKQQLNQPKTEYERLHKRTLLFKPLGRRNEKRR